jgi:predicted nucleotidyltransferase
MLRDRILLTLKFFDRLQTPLTLAELRDFLLNEPELIKNNLDDKFELIKPIEISLPATSEQIQHILSEDMKNDVEQISGLICLTGNSQLINQRIRNAVFQKYRDRLTSRFIPILHHLPFVRGVAVGGSHTLGSNKPESDIDLLIILDPRYMWLARVLLTGYLQLTGHRRHGVQIANRFCLNHYLAGPIAVKTERDPYNAMEYLRLKPIVYGESIQKFVSNNLEWIRQFFPNAHAPAFEVQTQTSLQKFLEAIFDNSFGTWLNQRLGQWQMRRIYRGIPAVADERELSFHSLPRKMGFLAEIFKN